MKISSKKNKRWIFLPLIATIFLVACSSVTKKTGISMKSDQPVIVDQIFVDSVWAANGVGFDLKTVGEKQFVAYYDRNRMMTVASRYLGEEQWQKATLSNQLMWDSHNRVVLGIDEMGYIHVSGNMHVHPLAYFRSTIPYDVNSMVEVNTMVGIDEDHITYPSFFNDKKGRLFFSYRSGSCGNGNILINRFIPEQGQWERNLDVPLFEGVEENDDRAAYHHWVKDSKGNFHFAWIWRWTPNVETSHNICYAKTPDLERWTNANDEPVHLPFTPDNEKLLVDGTPSKGGMHNSRYKLILTPNDTPVIGYIKYDEEGFTQFYLAKPFDGKWVSKKISNWDFRWKFIDGGAFMTIGGSFNFVGISNENILAVDWQTEKGESGRYNINLKTLEHANKEVHVQRWLPEDIGSKMTDRPKMNVRMAHDKDESPQGINYVLKWEAEHGGFKKHAPKNIPTKPLSKLVLLKVGLE